MRFYLWHSLLIVLLMGRSIWDKIAIIYWSGNSLPIFTQSIILLIRIFPNVVLRQDDTDYPMAAFLASIIVLPTVSILYIPASMFASHMSVKNGLKSLYWCISSIKLSLFCKPSAKNNMILLILSLSSLICDLLCPHLL